MLKKELYKPYCYEVELMREIDFEDTYDSDEFLHIPLMSAGRKKDIFITIAPGIRATATPHFYGRKLLKST